MRGTRSAKQQQTVDWTSVMLLANGCASEYIEDGEYSVRLEGYGYEAARSTGGDPVLSMQEGIPVLFYVKDKGFQQRILTVDNRLSFCYIMSTTHKVDKTNMMVVPLHQVKVWAHAEALTLCRRRGIYDPNMTCDSLVCLELLVSDKGDEGAEVLVFIAPTSTHLKERIEACSDIRQKEAQKARREGGELDTARLDGLRCKDALAIYKEPKYVDFEMQFLNANGHPGGKLASHRLKLPLQHKKCPEELQRMEEKNIKFAPTDRARVIYVLREMLTAHNWAKSFKRLFQEDFYTFATTPVTKKAHQEAGDDVQGHETPELCGQDTIEHVCQTPHLPDEDHYSVVFIRTLLCALKQSMDLHNEIIRAKTHLQHLESQINELPPELARARREAIARRVAAGQQAMGESHMESEAISDVFSTGEAPGAQTPQGEDGEKKVESKRTTFGFNLFGGSEEPNPGDSPKGSKKDGGDTKTSAAGSRGRASMSFGSFFSAKGHEEQH